MPESYPSVERSFGPEEFQPHDPFRPYVERGIELFKQGVTDASDWASEMVDEFGDKISPYISHIRKQAEGIASAFTPAPASDVAAGAPTTAPVATAPVAAPTPQRSAAADGTYGYAYAAPGHLPGEPAIPMPVGPPDPAAGPANQRYTMPSGVVAARYTQDYHERQQQLDHQANVAKKARDMAFQDAQAYNMMIRVAKSTKDIETAKRAIDMMGLQRDIQSGVAIHEAVARHPMALGSGYGSTLKNTEAPGKTSWVPAAGGAPGYVQDPRGTPHFPPASLMEAAPLSNQATPITTPEGKVLGYRSATGPSTGTVIRSAPEGKLSDIQKIKLTSRIKERAKLDEEMSGSAFQMKVAAGGNWKDYTDKKIADAKRLDQEIAELEAGGTPAAAIAPSAPSGGKKAFKNPATGQWEVR